MTAQNFAEITPSAHDTTKLALWMSCGGAVEVLSADDAANARNRRHDVGDDGLRAGRFTTNPFSCADDGLRATDYTGVMPNCSGGLQSSNVTKGYACIPPSVDDGLQGGGAGTQGWSCFGTVDDGLRAGNVSSDFCGGPGADDGLLAGNASISCGP